MSRYRRFNEQSNQEKLLHISGNFMLAHGVPLAGNTNHNYIFASYENVARLGVEGRIVRNAGIYVPVFAHLSVDEGAGEARIKVDSSWQDASDVENVFGEYIIDRFIELSPIDLTCMPNKG